MKAQKQRMKGGNGREKGGREKKTSLPLTRSQQIEASCKNFLAQKKGMGF